MEDVVRSGDRVESGTPDPPPAAPAPQTDGRTPRLTQSTRVVLVGAFGFALLCASLGAFAMSGSRFGDPWVLAPFVAFEGIHWACAIGFQPNDDDLVKQFDQ